MKGLVLLVEDNPQILKNIHMILTFNEYETITAINGAEAIRKLSEANKTPNIIVSDIMMPEMDGYQLFQIISKNPKWSSIPFIFLTAKANPEDVRLGKLLGVDDYLTKPFKEEDFLASIEGKISRINSINQVNEKLRDTIKETPLSTKLKSEKLNEESVCVIFALWDEEDGPVTREFFPKDWSLSYSVEDIGAQLFQATTAVYGYDKYDQSYGMLIDIKNISNSGYIYFDSYSDENVRGELRQFMIGVIAPKITYFDSLKIKSLLEGFSNLIKQKKDWDIEEIWNGVTKAIINVN